MDEHNFFIHANRQNRCPSASKRTADGWLNSYPNSITFYPRWGTGVTSQISSCASDSAWAFKRSSLHASYFDACPMCQCTATTLLDMDERGFEWMNDEHGFFTHVHLPKSMSRWLSSYELSSMHCITQLAWIVDMPRV